MTRRQPREGEPAALSTRQHANPLEDVVAPEQKTGELLRAPARFLRALPRAVPADELFGPRDLLGLLRAGLLERGVALGALTRVSRVPAAVLHHGPALE